MKESDMDQPSRTVAIAGHRTACAPQWRWDNPGRESGCYNLWLVVCGRGTMEVRSQRYDLASGDCFLLPMGEPCRARHDPRTPLTVPWLIFRPGDDLVLPERLHRRVVNLSLLDTLLEQSIRGLCDDDPACDHGVDWLRTALHLVRDEDRYACRPCAACDHADAIHRICERIRLEPGRRWRVGELAAETGFSNDHFTRLFRRHAGVSPRTFLTRTRTEAARALLHMSDLRIGEIADQLGYDDAFHFSRQFREQTGRSPNAWRKDPGATVSMANRETDPERAETRSPRPTRDRDAGDGVPLDCIVVAGDLPQEFLGTQTRERMRLHLDGAPASLAYLAHYFANGRNGDAARAALGDVRRGFVGLNGPYLCQHLEDHGLRTARIDLLSAQKEDFAGLLARKPRVIVLSTTFLPLAEHIDAMAAKLKATAPWATLVVGGIQVWKGYQHRLRMLAGEIDDQILPHVVAHNYLMDEERPSPVDILIVSARGEDTLVELVRRLRDGRDWQDLPNLARQVDGRWRLNPVVDENYRPVNVDWRRHLLVDRPLYLPIQAGIGCGFRCAFCDFCALHPQVRMRQPDEIVAEIATMPVADDGLRRVYFTDDNLFANRDRARSMCRALIASGMRLRWRGMFRIGILDDEIANLLAESGCLEVMLGIESGDPGILANMNKRIDPDQALAGLALLNRYGINTKSFFIVGFPGETARSIDTTIDFLDAYPTAGPGVHRYTLFTFAPLPLAAVSSSAARARWQLRGYGFQWRHATMDSDQADAQMQRMFGRIKPELSPSYSLEVPELPGLSAKDLKEVYLRRNRLALCDDRDPARAENLDALERAFAHCDTGRLVVAG